MIENIKLQEITQEILEVLIEEKWQLIYEIKRGSQDIQLLKDEVEKKLIEKYFFVNKEDVLQDIVNHLFGYGILQELIDDVGITDIDVINYNYITYKKDGKRFVSDVAFDSEQSLNHFAQLMVIRNGGVINSNDSHSRVSDERNRLRINVSIPPRNVGGSSFCIRKHRVEHFSLEMLKKKGMLNAYQYDFIKNAAKLDYKILVCGKGGAGKTTLLRAILDIQPEDDRVLVCESDTELYPEGNQFIVQRIKKGSEGGKRVTLNDLVKDGLTMSLDTYCVGEIVGEEAWEFIKAGYTDHKIYGTIHAKGAESAIYRLMTLIETTTRLSEETMLKMISESIDIVIYLKSFKVCEMVFVNFENNQLKLVPCL